MKKYTVPIVIGICGLLIISLSAIPIKPTFIINDSASAPMGLYKASEAPQTRLSWVTVDTTHIHADRTLPGHILKRIVALAGDHVKVDFTGVYINGVFQVDTAQFYAPYHPIDREIQPGEVFLLNPSPHSFDSRYFGPVAQSACTHVEPLLVQ